MKTLPLVTGCLLTALLTPPLAAQETPRRPAAPRPRVAPRVETPADALGENIVIRLRGSTGTGADVDLSLSGIGPKFSAEQLVGEDNTLLRCQYAVEKSGSGYRVSYAISARLKLVKQVPQGGTNVEYHDVDTTGTVLCVENRPVVLVRNGRKTLELTISRATEQGGAHEAPPRHDSHQE